MLTIKIKKLKIRDNDAIMMNTVSVVECYYQVTIDENPRINPAQSDYPGKLGRVIKLDNDRE